MGCWWSLLLCISSACLAVLGTLFFQQFQPKHLPPLKQHRALPSVDHGLDQHFRSGDTGDDQIIDVAQALGLGRVLLARGEPEEAALAFRVAAKASTRDSESGHVAMAKAKHGLGLALRAVGRPDEALEAFQEADRLDPSFAAASICIGSILTENGAWESALVAFRRAAELEPDAAESNGSLGAALLATGQIDEAIPILVRATVADPRDYHAVYNLGVAWQSKVSYRASRRGFAAACLLRPLAFPHRT